MPTDICSDGLDNRLFAGVKLRKVSLYLLYGGSLVLLSLYYSVDNTG